MTIDEFDTDRDADLAKRLARSMPDIADDGFTVSVMARLPAAAPAPRVERDEAPWLLGTMLVLALACGFVLIYPDTAPGSPAEALANMPLALTEQAHQSASAWLAALREVFTDHLSALVAGTLCLFTLLAPTLLED